MCFVYLHMCMCVYMCTGLQYFLKVGDSFLKNGPQEEIYFTLQPNTYIRVCIFIYLSNQMKLQIHKSYSYCVFQYFPFCSVLFYLVIFKCWLQSNKPISPLSLNNIRAQWFSKWGPRTSSISFTRELVRNADSWDPVQTNRIRGSGGGPGNLYLVQVILMHDKI